MELSATSSMERENPQHLRWEARVRQRAVDLAYRYPKRAPEILFKMLERLECGPLPASKWREW